MMKLSVSEATSFMKCGLAWEFSYVKKLFAPPNEFMIRGRALDVAASEQARRMAESDGLLGMTEEEFIAQAIVEHQSGAVDIETWASSAEESERAVARAARGYYRTFAGSLIPATEGDVQKWADMESPRMPLRIVGKIDMVTAAGVVVDIKLQGKFPSTRDVDGNFQLSTYSMLTGLPNAGLAVVKPNGEANFYGTKRSPAHRVATMGRYEAVADAIQKGVLLPAAEGSWWCSATTCDHWHRCPFGAAGSTGVRAVPAEERDA